MRQELKVAEKWQKGSKSNYGIETPKIPDLFKIALKVDTETLYITSEVRTRKRQKVARMASNCYEYQIFPQIWQKGQ